MEKFSHSISFMEKNELQNAMEKIDIEITTVGDLTIEKKSFIENETLDFISFDKKSLNIFYAFLEKNKELFLEKTES